MCSSDLDRLGVVVAPAGDVDADGYADVWMTSTHNTDGGTAGSAWLFNGPLAGDVPTTDAALLVYASASSSGLGTALVGDQDLDGDGDLDLLVSSSGASHNTGVVLLLLDAPSATGSLSAGLADAELTGEGSSGGAGNVLTAGDLDGDGVSDIVVGAKNQDDALNNAGAVYVLTHTPSGTEALADADGRFTGNEASAYLGISLTYAGDVDGDGFGDLLVGQVWGGASDEGAVWLVPGTATGDSSIADVSTAQVYGDAAGDAMGQAIAACGDVDADGYADFGAGAYAESTQGSSAGAVYRFYGPITGVLAGADADSIVYGEDPGDEAARGLACGDTDGDGVSELLVGASERTVTLGAEGEVYLLPW